MKNIMLFYTFLFIFSCKNNSTQNTATNTTASDAYKVELQAIMDVHDEVMPKMDDIARYQQQIRGEIAKTKDAGLKAKMLQSTTNLEKADEAMFAWMEQFKGDFAGMTPEQISSYLASEQIKVNEMKNKINNSLTEAEALLLMLKK